MPSYVSRWIRSDQPARSCSIERALGPPAGRPPDRGAVGPHADGHGLAFAADHAPPEVRRDEAQVDELRLLIAERLDEAGFFVGPGTDRQQPQVRGGLRRECRERPADDLVVHRFIEIERQSQARAEEPVLLLDAGRTRHQGGVAPDRHDRRLDG